MHTSGELLKLEVRPSTIAGAGLGLFAALPSLPAPSVACNRNHDYASDEDEPSAEVSASSALSAPKSEAPIVFNNGDLIYYMGAFELQLTSATGSAHILTTNTCHSVTRCTEGELLTRPQYETRYGASFDPTAAGEAWFTPYAARLPDGRIVDAIAARGVLACANDPRDRAKVRI